jgi:hypothetical protein
LNLKRLVQSCVTPVVVAIAMVACSGSDPADSSSPTIVTVTASASPSPSPSPEPDKAALATIRGPFNGRCHNVKVVGSVDFTGVSPQTHWKFRPQGDKLMLISKSGGYTMKLDRTSPTKYYGTTIQGNDWQYAYAIKITKTDTDGHARAIEVATHETAPGGFATVRALCHLTARGGGANITD